MAATVLGSSDVYAIGGGIIVEPGAAIGGASGTVLENGRWGKCDRELWRRENWCFSSMLQIAA